MKEKIISIKNKIVSTFIGLKNKMFPFIMANKKISITILVVLVIIIAVIIAMCGNKKIGNATGNLNNRGFSVKKGGWIYYEGYNEGAEDGIYKVKGNKKEKIAENYGIYLNTSGNFIYFIDVEEKNIIRMKSNGEDKKNIVEDVDLARMTIVDDWIYYFDEANLYKIKTNGKNKTILLEKNISNYEIIGNWIYYSYKNDGKYVIAKMKTNGEDNTKIDTETGKDFLVKGNYIYYIYENYDYENYEYSYELYKMKINGKDKKKLADIGSNVDINTVNFNENAVYYTKKDENGDSAIYKMDLRGKNETKIVDIEGYSTNINLHDNWIYYPDSDDNGDVQMFRIKANGEDKQNLSL